MVTSIGHVLVQADKVCDYIPVVSTISNLTVLFQKTIILPFSDRQTVINSRYYTHLEQKSALRCVMLLIPVIGNIVVGIYDFANRKYNDKAFMLTAVQQNGMALQYASEQLKSDRDVVLAAIRKNSWALEFASEQLKGDKDVVLAAVQQDGWALEFASEQLKGDKDVVLAAVQQNGLALQYASEQLKGDRAVVLAAIQQDGRALEYASEQLREEFRTNKILMKT